jgi:hypothetical protein
VPKAATERDSEVQELLDKQAIREVMVRYCRGLDRMDPELVASVYHCDATDDHGGRSFAGADIGPGIINWSRELNILTGNHHITNQTIRVDGDRAVSESYYSGFMLERRDDGASRTIQMVGRYLDRLERRNGEWRITQRLVVPEMVRYMPASADGPHWHLGQADRDPSYALLDSD